MGNDNVYDIEDIFNKWFNEIRTNGLRFVHSHRLEFVNRLAMMLKGANIDYTEAKMYIRKVINALTTEEGRKGHGKYKGWKECVETDYLSALADVYVEDTSLRKEATENIKIEEKIEEMDKSFYIDEDLLITNWCQNKFGDKWNENINKLAHLIGSPLNIEFMVDVFESDWAKTGQNVPDWSKDEYAQRRY